MNPGQYKQQHKVFRTNKFTCKSIHVSFQICSVYDPVPHWHGSKTHHALAEDGNTWDVSCATGCCGRVTYHLDLCGARVWLPSPCSLSPLTTSCQPASREAADIVCVQELSVVCIMHLLLSPKVCGISHCLLIKNTCTHLSSFGH